METETIVNGADKAPTPEKKAPPKKASKLKAVEPKGAEPSKPKILVFGAAGAGKTFTSLDFPASYYIDTEGGANRAHYTEKLQRSGGAYFGPEQGSLDGATVYEQVFALTTEEHNYRTLIIDSISKLFNKIIADEAERLGDKDAFGASKKPAVAWIRRLTNLLDRTDMNVILIAHQKEEWSGSGNNRESIGQTFDAWEKLAYELDLSLQIQKRGNSRVAIPRKSRLLGFPEGEAFPWSYEEFAKRYGKDIIERKSQVIELATAEDIQEIKRLLEVVKMSDEEIGKWFTKAKVESWEEMDVVTIAKCINFLKEKVK